MNHPHVGAVFVAAGRARLDPREHGERAEVVEQRVCVGGIAEGVEGVGLSRPSPQFAGRMVALFGRSRYLARVHRPSLLGG